MLSASPSRTQGVATSASGTHTELHTHTHTHTHWTAKGSLSAAGRVIKPRDTCRLPSDMRNGAMQTPGDVSGCGQGVAGVLDCASHCQGEHPGLTHVTSVSLTN